MFECFGFTVIFLFKKLSTETDLLFIGKIDFFKNLRISIFWGEKVVGGGGVSPSSKKWGTFPQD